MKLFYKAIAVLTALLIILPLLMVKAAAAEEFNLDDSVPGQDVTDIQAFLDIHFASGNGSVVIKGESAYPSGSYTRLYLKTGCSLEWQADTPNLRLEIEGQDDPALNPLDNLSFSMTGGSIDMLSIASSFAPQTTGRVLISAGSVERVINLSPLTVYYEPGAYIGDPTGNVQELVSDPEPTNGTTPETSADTETTEPSTSSAPSAPTPDKPKTFNSFSYEINDPVKEQYIKPEIEIIDNEQFKKDGLTYYGTVDIKGVDSDTPQEIPSKVFIDGKRYAVGETVYIVGEDEKKIEATADTGFSYVFTAVENSERHVKFTAEGLPEGLEMTEDGVITTAILPAPVGTFEITVTADNGADTNEYKMTIEIKEGGLSDEDLLAALTANDIPELLSEPQEDVPGVWTNDELSIHYEPEIEDFYALFLDGKLLTKDKDYRVEEGSTVIILTEQTMIPLPTGDHVVTTMFHQNTDVGMDTVINDVGSSSYVFRFGDEKTSGKRVNIGGDGVTGSVTFDDTASKEEPITAISANSEAIQKRAANLSNATGREIIAAFETKQHGGFGGTSTAPAGRVATFAVSVKSLNLSLKNGTAVYVAVYDSTTGKTYQNKGEVKDGMIVFRTVHSGVFMVALEKF